MHTEENTMAASRVRHILITALLLAALGGTARADGFRDIGSVTLDTYFDGSWHLETTDVFLARLNPVLSLQARLTRNDASGYYQHQFFIGPVVNFTPTLYLDAGYGLAVDSAGQFMHEGEANFNFETDESGAAAGIRGDWFPATGYGYILPSVSGLFHPIAALSLFGKFFISFDTAAVVTESFWGEAEYTFTSQFAARAGVTVSRDTGFGYSLIAGASYAFTPDIVLKYTFQFLSNTVQYLEQAPQQNNGVSNALIIDVKF
jgi:hypothetical protein